MCISPIKIKNKNKLPSHMIQSRVGLMPFKDYTSDYILVPCGVCASCLALKQSYWIQRCQLEAMDNYLFFGTLTYNNDMLPIVDINGYNHQYADFTHVQKMIKRIRKNYELPKFKYIFVSEYGTHTHRPHFHFILFFPQKDKHKFDKLLAIQLEKKLYDIIKKEWRVNKGSSRNPRYIPLHTPITSFNNYNYDCHFVNNDDSNVAFYVSKYILKYDSWFRKKQQALRLNLDESEYYTYYNLLKPKTLVSKGFGSSPSSQEYVAHSINSSISNGLAYPTFTNPNTLQTFPLAPYLRKYITYNQKLKLYNNQEEKDNVLQHSIDIDANKINNTITNSKKIQNYLDNKYN